MGILQEIAAEYQTNKIRRQDESIHNWYRFVLSYPPHLVKYFIEKFNVSEKDTILDPFCGTGTTLIESKLNRINSIGIEANPVIKFVTRTKLNWNINSQNLLDVSLDILNRTNRKLIKEGINDFDLKSEKKVSLKTLSFESEKILITNSISPLPLHKALVLLEEIRAVNNEDIKDHMLLAFLKTVVSDASNLKFGPEVGVGKIKTDVSILNSWITNVNQIVHDLGRLENSYKDVSSEILLGDSRNINQYLSPNSIKAVITSPPYPNEKDYSRTTRLESVLLGLINNMDELRGVKKTFVRSNTRSVYKEDKDHIHVRDIKSIQKIAEQIERKRIELRKNSGFEKMYSKVVLQYFGGMAKHLANLRNSLEPGAKLAYVVGDQASYLRIMIRTGQILAEIAESLGYNVLNIELFRTRFATMSKEELREEVLILEWPHKNVR